MNRVSLRSRWPFCGSVRNCLQFPTSFGVLFRIDLEVLVGLDCLSELGAAMRINIVRRRDKSVHGDIIRVLCMVKSHLSWKRAKASIVAIPKFAQSHQAHTG